MSIDASGSQHTGPSHSDALANLRKDYRQARLDRGDLKACPFEQFQTWFQQAQDAQLPEPNAMTLATVNAEGQPSARTVLLKGFDRDGAVFYTNYNSRKGREILANPRVALLFFWPELERQLRIEGRAQKVSEALSDRYFQSRPRGSQLGAWASQQSAPLNHRKELMERQRALEAEYAGRDIPRPSHWGGFCVVPVRFEFWQGRSSRLHDRLCYVQQGGVWQIERLAP